MSKMRRWVAGYRLRCLIGMLAVVTVVGVGAAVCQREPASDLVLQPLPTEARDVVVEELGTVKYVDPSPARAFCGTDVYSTYSGGSVMHGLREDSVLPRELIDAVERIGSAIEEYEHRWFGERRIVLFSASPRDETKPLFVDAMEVVLIEDEEGQRTWSIPYRNVARPCG